MVLYKFLFGYGVFLVALAAVQFSLYPQSELIYLGASSSFLRSLANIGLVLGVATTLIGLGGLVAKTTSGGRNDTGGGYQDGHLTNPSTFSGGDFDD